MSELFFCQLTDRSRVILQDSEAHHAINVLRMKPKDSIRLFDGNGITARGHIASLNRREVAIEIESTETHSRPDWQQLTVAAASPKGDRLKWMIEKLTELGVTRFVPLQTARSVVYPGSSKLNKLNATVVSAAKQSGNLWLMEIAAPTSFEDLLEQKNSGYVLAHPSPARDGSAAVGDAAAVGRTLLIGPEGGFTDEEVAFADQFNCQRVSWSGTILRTETAAVVFAALVSRRC